MYNVRRIPDSRVAKAVLFGQQKPERVLQVHLVSDTRIHQGLVNLRTYHIFGQNGRSRPCMHREAWGQIATLCIQFAILGGAEKQLLRLGELEGSLCAAALSP